MLVKIDRQFVLRISVYLFSLAVLAVGVVFAVNSNLGVSPVNSLPFALSEVFQIPLSSSIIIVYTIFVLLQIVILKKDFKPYLLLQLAFAVIFGYFVDLFKLIIGTFRFPGYVGQLVMVAISALFIGVGVAMYLCVQLLPLPMEGLVSAITTAFKGKVKFSVVKTGCDSACVLIAAILSFVFLGKLVGVREGTVITALLLGPIVGLAQKHLTPRIEKVVFDKTPPVIV